MIWDILSSFLLRHNVCRYSLYTFTAASISAERFYSRLPSNVDGNVCAAIGWKSVVRQNRSGSWKVVWRKSKGRGKTSQYVPAPRRLCLLQLIAQREERLRASTDETRLYCFLARWSERHAKSSSHTGTSGVRPPTRQTVFSCSNAKIRKKWFQLHFAGFRRALCIVWTGSNDRKILCETNIDAARKHDCDCSSLDLAKKKKMKFCNIVECNSGDSCLHAGSGRHTVAVGLFVWIACMWAPQHCQKKNGCFSGCA